MVSEPTQSTEKSAFSVWSVLPYVSMAAPLRLEKSRFFVCFEFEEFLNENFNAVQGKSAANTGVFASILTP